MRIYLKSAFLILLMFTISCSITKKNEFVDLNNFAYGKWDMYKFVKHFPALFTTGKADEFMQNKKNVVIEKNRFSFGSFSLNNPRYVIRKMNLKEGREKESNRYSYDYGYMKNRMIKKILIVKMKGKKVYEFEIISPDRLLIMYGGYFFILRKK